MHVCNAATLSCAGPCHAVRGLFSNRARALHSNCGSSLPFHSIVATRRRSALTTCKMAAVPIKQELLRLQQELLDSIAQRDWNKYALLCDESLTAFEPEAVGHLVQGLPFHKYYFDYLSERANYKSPTNTISQPHVRMLGDNAAVVSYIRLQQKLDSNQRPITVATEETRVWQKVNGAWKNVHFHRSPTTPSS